MICSRCGSDVPSGASFCNQCGNALQVAGPAARPIGDLPLGDPGRFGQIPVARPQLPPVSPEGAKITLGLGIGSWLLCGLPLGIPAIILGHRTLKKIDQSRGRLKGKEITLVGLILGYISSICWGIFLTIGGVAYMQTEKEIAANETATIATMREIVAAEATYSQSYSPPQSSSSSLPVYAGSLDMLGPGPDESCAKGGTAQYACLINGALAKPDCKTPRWCISNGYKFQLLTHYSYSSRTRDYSITATPVDGSHGSKNFCATSDQVIRSGLFFLSLYSAVDAEDCVRWKNVEEQR